MKLSSKLFTSIFLTNILFVGACKKDQAVSPTLVIVNQQLQPPKPQEDSSTGKEYIFNELVWVYDVDGGANLYIGIENRPDLFGTDRAVEVFIKSEIDNNWVKAEKFLYPNPNTPGYVYSIYSKSLFVFLSPHVFPTSANTQLADKKANIKVKFL